MEKTVQSQLKETVEPSPKSNPTPEPGSVWTREAESLKWIYIAQDGHRAIRIRTRKSTGKVMNIDMEGWIGVECREMK